MKFHNLIWGASLAKKRETAFPPVAARLAETSRKIAGGQATFGVCIVMQVTTQTNVLKKSENLLKNSC